jgi:hypothetical protein
MRAYSTDLRERILRAVDEGKPLKQEQRKEHLMVGTSSVQAKAMTLGYWSAVLAVVLLLA